MKIHKSKNKLKVVLDPEKLLRIAVCLANSGDLKDRMLALEIKTAMDQLNEREDKK